MPCLRLTPGQAQRLFGLRADVCARVLAGLVDEGTLTLRVPDETRTGTRDSGDVERQRELPGSACQSHCGTDAQERRFHCMRLAILRTRSRVILGRQ